MGPIGHPQPTADDQPGDLTGASRDARRLPTSQQCLAPKLAARAVFRGRWLWRTEEAGRTATATVPIRTTPFPKRSRLTETQP